MSSKNSEMNFAGALKTPQQQPAITTIVIPPTITNQQTPSTEQPPISSNSSFPLPRVNHTTFRSKWDNRFLSYSCGITLDPVHGAKQIEYLEEIDKIVDAKDIVSIGKNTDGRYVVFFTSEKYAETIIQNGLVVAGIYVTALPVTVRPTRVLVSNITPIIPDKVIVDFLKNYGRVTSPLRPVPINSNEQEKFAHILSARREIYVQIEKNFVIPSKIRIIHENNPTYITFETDVKCFKCQNSGHVASNCVANFPTLTNDTSDKKPISLEATEPQEKVSPNPKRLKTTENLLMSNPHQPTSSTPTNNSTEIDRTSPMDDDDDADSTTSEMSTELNTDMAQDIIDLFNNQFEGESALPLSTLVDLIKNLNNKKKLNAFKNIIIQHTSDFSSLQLDFRAIRHEIKTKSSNPTTTVRQITRIVTKLYALIKQEKRLLV